MFSRFIVFTGKFCYLVYLLVYSTRSKSPENKVLIIIALVVVVVIDFMWNVSENCHLLDWLTMKYMAWPKLNIYFETIGVIIYRIIHYRPKIQSKNFIWLQEAKISKFESLGMVWNQIKLVCMSCWTCSLIHSALLSLDKFKFVLQWMHVLYSINSQVPI